MQPVKQLGRTYSGMLVLTGQSHLELEKILAFLASFESNSTNPYPAFVVVGLQRWLGYNGRSPGNILTSTIFP
jgi:hypothetical protein